MNFEDKLIELGNIILSGVTQVKDKGLMFSLICISLLHVTWSTCTSQENNNGQ